mgnify:CR=1 FL=1
MIITMQSFRGGVGKSSLTKNLALEIALQGKHISLVDLDISAPSLHLCFNSDPRENTFTINDFLLERCELSHVLKNPRKGLDFYPASLELDKLCSLLENGYNIARLTKAIQELDKKSDVVLIDNHSSITEEAMGVLLVSHKILLVTTPDLSSLEGIFLWRAILERLGINEEKILIILNKVFAARQDIQKIQAQLLQGAKKTADFIFFFSEEIALDGNNGQTPIHLKYPKSVFSQTIRDLANKILN